MKVARLPSGDERFEVALPYRGLTPHRWQARALTGCTLLESRRRPPVAGGPGAGGYELATLQISVPEGPAEATFALVDISGRPIEERHLRIG